MCLYPKLIKNRKYTVTKKNGGKVPPLPLIKSASGRMIPDERVLLVPVGCGKCMECMKKKARDWNVRLQEEIRTNSDKAVFVTLTFSNESIKELGRESKLEGYDLDNYIAKKAVRRFCERWRKKYGKSIRHWLVTELGQNGTENIHLHGIMWTDKIVNEIDSIWNYGFTWCGTYVNEATVNYICKYIHKTDASHKEYKPIVLTSAGIGAGYTERMDGKNNKYKGKETREYYQGRNGSKMALPIYYRNKIYNDEEREKLWTQKLDEQVRYVNGIKIDISKSEENYFKVLNEARKKNKQLGYGDDKVNWEVKRYERERRIIKHMERLMSDATCRRGDASFHAQSEIAVQSAFSDIELPKMGMDEKSLKDIW